MFVNRPGFRLVSISVVRSARCASTKFQEGDLVLLRSLARPDKVSLSKPLEKDGQLSVPDGKIEHNDLIGSFPRSTILQSHRRKDRYMAVHPTLEEYISLSDRDAQPIYAPDAAAIVSMMDIHVDYPALSHSGELLEKPLQYLEAGSGHGSFSIAMARAIHAANCHATESKPELRGAILHSIDNRELHSKRAAKTVKNFKRGMYSKNVEFHVAESPSSWLTGEDSAKYRKLSNDLQLDDRLESEFAFLSGAFLDMADSHLEIKEVAKSLKHDAPLVIFTPSITQIMEAIKLVQEDRDIKLTFVRCAEITSGAGGGMREWDTRLTYVRKTGEQVAVCRPKVGIRVQGGGFIGMFKKIPNDSRPKKDEAATESEAEINAKITLKQEGIAEDESLDNVEK
ncbi:unnamed protein product [Kuraishia capsulata CBS 1993]|uniref:tRNA (adenine(58)-N(1))-methyltransferase catalytic subunit TRM61 n=1 Tax=Kuraishia capsulata CBS 1993 TaxID=1382522 RepID=W6MTF0_9ASCO|nr:uncharacterized protein KUCA_T00005994001 [Kuraishia capsulata CBS 1993]CDK29999.1 unnamed protein product [Kuraishia capsulata CBS 1993]